MSSCTKTTRLALSDTVLCKKVSSASRTVRESSRTVCKDLFASNVATNFKLCARMDCIIIYCITRTQIANLLRKLPV